MHVASIDGLEGTTLGRHSTDPGMPKGSLQALSPAKEDLQLAVIAAAYEVFTSRLLSTPGKAEPGLPSPFVLFDAWIGYQETFNFGCFFAAAFRQFDSRPGPSGMRSGAHTPGRPPSGCDQLHLTGRMGDLLPDTEIDQSSSKCTARYSKRTSAANSSDISKPTTASWAICDRLARATNTQPHRRREKSPAWCELRSAQPMSSTKAVTGPSS